MKKSILIVEDESIVAQDIASALESAGYTVAGIAASADEARALLQLNKPMLVLLDILLNGNDTGIDLAGEMKRDDIPFVFLSANSNRRTFERAKATEPYGFLVKPFRERELVMMLDIALHRHQKAAESEFAAQQRLEKKLQELEGLSRPGKSEKGLAEGMGLLAASLQPFVSFDLFTIERSGIGMDISWHGALRTGFGEYQIIDLPALEMIGGQPVSLLAEWIAGNPTELSRVLQKKYALASEHSCCLRDDGKSRLFIRFFCRTRDRYETRLVDAIARVEGLLRRCVESLLSAEEGRGGGDIRRDAGSADSPIRLTHAAQFSGIIGRSASWLAVLDLVTRVAPVDSNVLLLGESGSGKELIAETVHRLSPRSHGPLVKVNCAALPANLIESELFGFEKGAFTDATQSHTGKFEQAAHGTLLLDEVGEIPLELQAKLLRVLQSGEIERIGGKQTVKTDVRIIAATNKDLRQEMAAGRFRLDLYYRLSVFPIELPPLRERREDIADLAIHFARRFAEKFQKTFAGISPDMLAQLQEYSFPGNIRELENIIERAVILCGPGEPLRWDGWVGRHLRPDTTGGERIPTIEEVKRLQKQTEADYIRRVLALTGGRIRGRGGAAELLNEKPTTLESRMQRLGISKDEYK